MSTAPIDAYDIAQRIADSRQRDESRAVLFNQIINALVDGGVCDKLAAMVAADYALNRHVW